MQLEIILLIIFGIWLAVLTFLLYLYVNFFNRLAKGVGGGNLKKVLDTISSTQELNAKEIEHIKGQLSTIEEKDHFYFQKIGLVRYNPFKDLGGDHSFSLAILDGKENGMIITSFHTRERTRLYMKLIKNGRSEHELSDEEREALKKAASGK